VCGTQADGTIRFVLLSDVPGTHWQSDVDDIIPLLSEKSQSIDRHVPYSNTYSKGAEFFLAIFSDCVIDCLRSGLARGRACVAESDDTQYNTSN
jgi:hypothetical protein